MLFLLGSLGLVIVAILFSFIINKTKSDSPTTDVRARASAVSTLEMLGTVQNFDANRGVVVLTQVAFASDPDKNLGVWTVSVPKDTKPLVGGNRVSFTIDPQSFSVNTKTVKAVQFH